MILLVSPILLLLDKDLNIWEGVLLIILYLGLAYALYREDSKKPSSDNEVVMTFANPQSLVLMIIGIIVGSGILIFSSNILVKETIDIAHDFGIAPFLVSLLALSIGTNLPEIALMIRTVLKGENEIAFGNYLGSATFNTLILGILGVVSGSTVITEDLIKIFVFIVVGLGLFYFFAKSKNELSRREGIILLTVYIIFLAVEIGTIILS